MWRVVCLRDLARSFVEFWLVAGRCQGRCGSSRGSKFELRSVPISSLPGSRGGAWLWWVLFASRDPTYGLKSATCFVNLSQLFPFPHLFNNFETPTSRIMIHPATHSLLWVSF